jgi:hypothetical protein
LYLRRDAGLVALPDLRAARGYRLLAGRSPFRV